MRPRRDRLAAVYSSCEIYLCPSWDEGLGMPPMEAMACGAAVVTYDNGGCRDYARDGETALVARRRDIGDLAAKLERLVVDESLRARRALGARDGPRLRAAPRRARRAPHAAPGAAAPAAPQVELSAVARRRALPRRRLRLGRLAWRRPGARLARRRDRDGHGRRREGTAVHRGDLRRRRALGTLWPRELRRGHRVSRARTRARSRGGGAAHARVAGGRGARDHRGPERGRPRGQAVRPRVVGTGAAATPLALHPEDARAHGAEGGWPRRLVLAPGEAPVLSLEPVPCPARPRLGLARSRRGIPPRVRRAEAPAGGDAAARALGTARRGDQDRGDASVMRAARAGRSHRVLRLVAACRFTSTSVTTVGAGSVCSSFVPPRLRLRPARAVTDPA